jgi:hypothetical protein
MLLPVLSCWPTLPVRRLLGPLSSSVALLNINFAIAIIVQCERLRKVFTMHCIVRNLWLDTRPELLRRLQENSISSKVLALTTFPRWVATVTVFAQFLPILFVLLIVPFNEYTP